jgi:deazaflavin-dependent oxidoreductase (nitroreductase family)
MNGNRPEPGYSAPDLSLVGEAHVRRYLETGGEVGHVWNGAPCLLLTTTGRRSGQARQIAIIYSRDGANFVLIASKGGSPSHPGWYLNLLAQPRAQIQVKAQKLDVTARIAEGEERERLWRGAVQVWPNYDVYVTRTTRRIPVVVLEPARP